MFERMPDKSHEPDFSELIRFCGDAGKEWLAVEEFLTQSYDLKKEIRFPFGGDYGWSVHYAHKKKHICDIHAESGAFEVFCQIRADAIEPVKDVLSPYALKVWEERYPCGSGGWIHYRVTGAGQLDDVRTLLTAKVKPKSAKAR